MSHSSPYTVVADTVRVATVKPTVPAAARDAVDPRYASPAADPGEELVVEEEIELAPKDPHILTTLLTGLPSPSNILASGVTFLINLALLGMVADLTYRAPLFYPASDLSFSRVGYVSDTTAKILVREPDGSQLPIFLSYRYAEFEDVLRVAQADDAWKASGRIDWLDERTDFTDTFTLTGLRPDTRYQYRVSTNHSGHFTTAPKPGQISTRERNGNMFTFVHSSCLKLNFPYNPFQHPLTSKGFEHLNTVLAGLKAQFMLFLGDFIYADVPRQHGPRAEDFRLQYRQVYASPQWPTAVQHVPSWIHVYDDHEVRNDWSANETAPFPAAFDAYQHYHTAVNPPAVRPGASYFSFTQGPASFFLLDTRRYRSPNSAPDELDPTTGLPTKSMLGATQRADLLAWLARREPAGVRWKVLVSSVPFTRNWRLTAGDTWAGFLAERELLLAAMWDVGLRGDGVGVIILSGDRHEFAATAFPPPPDGQEVVVPAVGGLVQTTTKKRWPLSATVHEFSASPLGMFYLPVRTYAEGSVSADYVSDVCIKYLPDGNHKFGAVSISQPPTSEQSVLQYRLFIDGREAWSYTLTTPPAVGGAGRAKDAIWG